MEILRIKIGKGEVRAGQPPKLFRKNKFITLFWAQGGVLCVFS